MATPEQLAEFRKKALESPDIGKRGKGLKTIAREERQAIFDEFVSQEFVSLIEQAKPEYKLDRFMGKMPDKFEVEAKVDNTGGLSEEVISEAKRLLKEKLTHE